MAQRSRRRRVTSRPRPRAPRSKAASRNGSTPTCRSAAAVSPTTPRRATRWSRCRSRPDPIAEFVEAAGLRWVVGESLDAARTAAGKVQGRRTTVEHRAAVARCCRVPGRRRAARDVVGRARVPRARRVVVRARRRARVAARERRRVRRQGALAARRKRHASWPTGSDATVRVVYSREDVVRLGPKRPPIAATAVWRDGRRHDRRRRRARSAARRGRRRVRDRRSTRTGRVVDVAGPPVASELRAFGLAEHAVLVEGALDAARVDRATLTDDAALLDTLVVTPSGARAGARVTFDDASGRLAGVEVRVAAGDPLDEIVLAVLRARRRAHGAGLGAAPSRSPSIPTRARCTISRSARSASSARKDMPPVDDHDPRRRRPAARTLVRRGVRRGCRRDLERARTRRRRPARYVPRARDTRRPACSGGSHARRPPFPRRTRRRSRGRTRPRCAPATGSCSRARSGSIPRPASSSTASRRRPARCSPTSPRCSATAARRSTDVAKTTRVRHRPRRLRDGQRGLRRGVRRPQARRARPCRSPALPGGAQVEIEAWAYLGRSPPIHGVDAPQGVPAHQMGGLAYCSLAPWSELC